MPKVFETLLCVGLTLLLPFEQLSAADDEADAAMRSIRPEAIRGTMRFLADDALEGRGTATRGLEIAAKYMAAQFESLGLAPAGDDSTYFQRVPLRLTRADGAKSAVTLIREGKEEKLVFGTDFDKGGDAGRSEVSVEAPVVYVGFDATAPDQNYDDYKGIDVRGKLVAYVPGAPHFESSVRAHYSSGEVKAANAVAHGALGVIVLWDPQIEARFSFADLARNLATPQSRWLDKDKRPNAYFPELKGMTMLSPATSRRLFEGSGHTADEVFQAAKEGKPQSFVLPVTIRIQSRSNLQDVSSPNVVAKLEGSDPVLKNEYLLYSAHLDHMGISVPVNGDSIYNGALDNASGCAIILEVARAFTRINPRPKRSVLFLAVTGEESGLIGSDYFAHYSTVKKDSIVANINVDEDQMLWPLQDIIAYGAEHSSLEAVVNKAAARLQLSVSPDPAPDEVSFVRSDQYSFVKQGIPAIGPAAGFRSSDANINPAAISQKWEQTIYHHPQDDMQQPGLDFDQAVKFAQFAFLCGWLITEDPSRPTWKPKDFFGERYGKKM